MLLQTGIENTLVHAHNLGIHSELPQYPSLALGVADIPLSEMIKPYMAFANNGKLTQPYYLAEIKDKDGKILYQAPQAEFQEVLPAEEAHIMSNILSAVIEEGTGRRLKSNYGLVNELAGKTGTTQNQADGWFIGYNPRIVVGVRVGANNMNIHFNSTSLGQGANTALPIFGLFMQACLKDADYAYWERLTFPYVSIPQEKDLETPVFKEKMNLFDRIGNKKWRNVLWHILRTPLPRKRKKDYSGKSETCSGKKKNRKFQFTTENLKTEKELPGSVYYKF